MGWALLGLADWSERRYAWLGGTLVDMQLFKRLEGELEQVYVFALYDRRQYLLLTFLARHTRLVGDGRLPEHPAGPQLPPPARRHARGADLEGQPLRGRLLPGAGELSGVRA